MRSFASIQPGCQSWRLVHIQGVILGRLDQFRAWLGGCFVGLGNWISGKPEQIQPASIADTLRYCGLNVDSALVGEAEQLCAIESQDLDANGELRRHRVYAKLIRKYPNKPRKDIALAIEFAVQGVFTQPKGE